MSTSLSPDQRRRLEQFFDRAADLPAGERAAFVERACGSDIALRDELSRLLEGLTGDDVLEQLRHDAPSRAGTTIGPYRLLERVGLGGMGEVYAAEQSLPVVRRVALKLIRHGMHSAEVVARFGAERQALARMGHPNVAQVFDAGSTDDGRPYFVMEFVAGPPITEFADQRTLTTRERLELFLAVCDGVQHAHQKGVIHRDLKPSNLLVMEQEQRAVPKVIDFGVARATTGKLSEHSLHTLVGQVVGTLDYMSPEQADPGGADVDTRSDVYSLGVVLYQLLSGLLPFDHSSELGLPLSERQRVMREQDPPMPSTRLRKQTDTAASIARLHASDERSLTRQLAGDLDWICMRALEKDPGRRYQSVADLAEDVRRHLALEPVTARRTGPVYRARKFVRRHRVGVATGAVVAVSLAAGLVGIVSGRIEAQRSAARAATEHALVVPLKAAQELKELQGDAESLWPVTPDLVAAYDTWLERAEALSASLEASAEDANVNEPGLRAQLLAIRERALPETPADSGIDPSHPEHDEWERSREEIELTQKWLEYVSAKAGDERDAKETEWAEQAEALLPELIARLDELEARVTRRVGYAFTREDDAVWHGILSGIVSDVEAFATNAGAMASLPQELGWGMARRREFAASIDVRTLTGSDARERWSDAVASIADRDKCPLYDELRLEPQLGLLPLGRDARSGLWEFWHVQSGSEPVPGPDGRLAIDDETGIVLVLIPGGTDVLGAQGEDPRQPNFDGEQAKSNEGPIHEVEVSPYFLGKYEVTQGQWLRFTGGNPSEGRPEREDPEGGPRSLAHPVENLRWETARDVMWQMGLSLPSEAQWEYGARAGTDTPWWTGVDKASMAGAANTRDEAYIRERKGSSWRAGDEGPSDGWAYSSPVGHYRANDFGLHDVIGNAYEWCLDVNDPMYYRRLNKQAEESGRPVLDPVNDAGLSIHVFRSGGFGLDPEDARSATRFEGGVGFRVIGLRAARAVQH